MGGVARLLVETLTTLNELGADTKQRQEDPIVIVIVDKLVSLASGSADSEVVARAFQTCQNLSQMRDD